MATKTKRRRHGRVRGRRKAATAPAAERERRGLPGHCFPPASTRAVLIPGRGSRTWAAGTNWATCGNGRSPGKLADHGWAGWPTFRESGAGRRRGGDARDAWE